MEILGKIECHKCKGMLFHMNKCKFINGTIHNQAVCADCGEKLQYVKQESPVKYDEDVDITPEEAGDVELAFGKHKGKKIKHVDPAYLEWCLREENAKWNGWISKRIEIYFSGNPQ